MQPYTLDQSIITGLLFILGVLIGMFIMAGNKWKRRYLAEAQDREALAVENEQLRADAREMESLRHAAAKAPAQPAPVHGTPAHERTVTQVEEVRTVRTDPADAYRRNDGTVSDQPDIVIKRP